jgi:hypothetical protein
MHHQTVLHRVVDHIGDLLEENGLIEEDFVVVPGLKHGPDPLLSELVDPTRDPELEVPHELRHIPEWEPRNEVEMVAQKRETNHIYLMKGRSPG